MDAVSYVPSMVVVVVVVVCPQAALYKAEH